MASTARMRPPPLGPRDNPAIPPYFQAAARESASNKPLFVSPAAAGRRITAGFSFLQRIGKSASIDVWFPEQLQKELNARISRGDILGPDNFPAEWAAVRQFELLQDAANYKIYDMHADYLTRSLMDITRNMRGGGYRVTVATIGSYSNAAAQDDLAILDKRLQKRIQHLIQMLYLEEQSESINQEMDAALKAGVWDYQLALPHVGATLGARDLFRPLEPQIHHARQNLIIPRAPHIVPTAQLPNWAHDFGVVDADYSQAFIAVSRKPEAGEYRQHNGLYEFARDDTGREVTVTYLRNAVGTDTQRKPNRSERKHALAKQFFDILDLLPQSNIVHDTAVGLQLPESINEHEWIYLTKGDETAYAFNNLLTDLFAPFDGINMAALDGRADATPEIKGTTQHMRGHGDRLTADADQFYRRLAAMAPH